MAAKAANGAEDAAVDPVATGNRAAQGVSRLINVWHVAFLGDRVVDP